MKALASHDCGVLAATTAFGKTVVAAALIARRGRNTLVLVHRRQLVEQWVERLRAFLSLEAGDGVIVGGKRKPSGRIDVALIQSLVRKGQVSDLIAGYGHLVVDECHHLSAVSFGFSWPGARRPATCLGFQRPSPGRMAINRSSSLCSAAWCGTAWMPAPRPYVDLRAPGAAAGNHLPATIGTRGRSAGFNAGRLHRACGG